MAQSIEQTLNIGDNGKNLHQHLKITFPDGGVLTAEAIHDKAMQAVLKKLDAMVKNAEKE